jgi:hypothetical protein
LNRALRNVSEFRYSAGLDLRVGVRLPAARCAIPEIVDVIQRSLGTWSRRPGTLILGISQTSALLADDAPGKPWFASRKLASSWRLTTR